MADGLVTPSTEGAVQGSPLSPLLSNIVLDELDKELERRGLPATGLKAALADRLTCEHLLINHVSARHSPSEAHRLVEERRLSRPPSFRPVTACLGAIVEGDLVGHAAVLHSELGPLHLRR